MSAMDGGRDRHLPVHLILPRRSRPGRVVEPSAATLRLRELKRMRSVLSIRDKRSCSRQRSGSSSAGSRVGRRHVQRRARGAGSGRTPAGSRFTGPACPPFPPVALPLLPPLLLPPVPPPEPPSLKRFRSRRPRRHRHFRNPRARATRRAPIQTRSASEKGHHKTHEGARPKRLPSWRFASPTRLRSLLVELRPRYPSHSRLRAPSSRGSESGRVL
jgi:hypothetical protein